MKPVYVHLLHVPLDPLCGLADDDEAVFSFRSIDPNNESQLKEVIRVRLVPAFEALSDVMKQDIKLALRYYLTTDKVSFERVWHSVLPPFDPPVPAKKFFLWLWDVLFPGEIFMLEDLESYRESFDPNKANRR